MSEAPDQDSGNILARFAEISEDAVLVVDAAGAVAFTNPAAEVMFGYDPGKMLGQIAHRSLLPPRSRLPAARAFETLLQSNEHDNTPRTRLVTAQRSDGKRIRVKVTLFVQRVGGVFTCLAAIRDISERVAEKRRLEKYRGNLQSLVNQNQSGILVLDSRGEVLFVNPAAEYLLQRDAEKLLGVNFGVPSQFSERQHIEILHPDGKLRHVEMTATRTEWEDAPAHLLMLHDITYLREAEGKIRELVHRDSLTGLPNRLLFTEYLDQFIRDAERNESAIIAVLFMDLDRFKQVNDNLGHDMGDRLLVAVAKRLKDVFRASDTLARFGGDEFVAIVRDTRNKADLQFLIDRILAVFSTPFTIDGRLIESNISIGVSYYPDDADNLEELIRLADTAMYEAKADRVGLRYSYYSTSMGEISHARYKLENEIGGAIQAEEFILFYQPQIDLRSGELCGFEALIRWQHPEHGLVGPDKFIPLMEENGKILEVGHWVIQQALRQQNIWLSAGIKLVPVAVNVSGVQLDHGNLAWQVEHELSSQNLPPSSLVMEVTESVVVKNITEVNILLRKFEELGVAIHLDDFGTGTASMSMLKKIPVSTIKIDQSFVSGLTQNASDEALVKAIINVAHSLGKTVLAEGIETRQQCDELIRLGCERGQGYLFGKPMAPDDVVANGWLDPGKRFL